jgi:hypothetical protein
VNREIHPLVVFQFFSISRDGRKEKERENSRHDGKGENRQQLSIEQINLYFISFDDVGLSVQRICF